MRIHAIAALSAAAVLLAGCINQRIVVVVNPDGSGNIVMSQLMSKEAAGMIEGMAAGFGSAFGATNAAAPSDPFFDEAKFKKAAAEFGEGVEYVKAQKLEKDGSKGAVVAYKFADVTKLRFPLEGAAKSLGGGMGQEAEEDKPADPKELVRFAFAPGPTKKLTINLPDSVKEALTSDKAADAAADAAKKQPKGPEAEMAKQMAMQMFKGMRMAMQVEVKGEVVKSNAAYPDAEKPTRFTIMDVNFDEILSSPQGSALLSGENEELVKNLVKAGKIPGMKMETNTQVVIEFK